MHVLGKGTIFSFPFSPSCSKIRKYDSANLLQNSADRGIFTRPCLCKSEADDRLVVLDPRGRGRLADGLDVVGEGQPASRDVDEGDVAAVEQTIVLETRVKEPPCAPSKFIGLHQCNI